jgi:hypothetical protein
MGSTLYLTASIKPQALQLTQLLGELSRLVQTHLEGLIGLREFGVVR